MAVDYRLRVIVRDDGRCCRTCPNRGDIRMLKTPNGVMESYHCPELDVTVTERHICKLYPEAN